MASKIYDLIIIGGGIAAHTAAIYAARAKLDLIVISALEQDQLSQTGIVENWPGSPKGIFGAELVANTKKQAESFGAKYVYEKAISFENKKAYFEVLTENAKYSALSVIVATGASAKKLGIPGESKFFGKGVSVCATCDASFYRDKIVAVIGGGDSAMEESLHLAKFAKKVYLIHRRDKFRASKIMQERVIKMKNKIEIMLDSAPIEIVGDKKVSGIKIKNVETGKITEIKLDGVFLAIGHIPNTEFLKGKIKLDEEGYIITDKFSRTSIEGVYAAGDVQDRFFRQAITSAGAGCQAAIQAERYVEERKAEKKRG